MEQLQNFMNYIETFVIAEKLENKVAKESVVFEYTIYGEHYGVVISYKKTVKSSQYKVESYAFKSPSVEGSREKLFKEIKRKYKHNNSSYNKKRDSMFFMFNDQFMSKDSFMGILNMLT